MTDTLRIIPLGGVGEVGKNITLLEVAGEILVIDCGLAFPEPEMLGIDLVIPDVTYLAENKDRVRAILLTHGHEDHTGALPYVLPHLPGIPIYASRLTIGLVTGKLKEHKLLEATPLRTVGFDSLMALEIRNRLQDRAGVTVPLVTLIEGPSIGDLAALMLERFNDRAAAPSDADADTELRIGDDELGELSDESVDAMLRQMLAER